MTAKVAYEAFNAKVMSGEGTAEECDTIRDMLYSHLKQTFISYYEYININPECIAKVNRDLDKVVLENRSIQMLIPALFILRQKIDNPDLKCYRSMAIPSNHQHAIRPVHKMLASHFVNPDA